ncbi:MAG: YraN family protein [Gemmatimonadetes bacterium]|nr:YraN family protein [Gemmatimonadota bacterium]
MGLQGEAAAIRFLRDNGWQVLDHRFRLGRFEVDLVVRKGALVAFVEVKTRSGKGFGTPFEAVTWSKRREIGRVAQAWVDRHGRPEDTYRFDVIGVVFRCGVISGLEHMQDAFRMAR